MAYPAHQTVTFRCLSNFLSLSWSSVPQISAFLVIAVLEMGKTHSSENIIQYMKLDSEDMLSIHDIEDETR